IDGTQNALDLAAALKVKCFHHTSSIAAAGLYPGVFREDMFEEAEGLEDPYLRTKHESEGLVRAEKRVKWRIYRPGMVVGHSQTGVMDKID
ncbi:SDR family oxidoreductase, partial [Salmonella enterica subsp. enterica serovar 1,4,[5],12:i:-]